MEKKNNNNDLLSGKAKEFSESMKQAIDENPAYDTERINLRPVDYSFMDEIEVSAREEIQGSPTKKGKKHTWQYFAKIAVIVILFFSAVLATSIYINSEPAIAAKFKLEKKFHEITKGLLSTDENAGQNAPDDNAITYHINSMDEMDYAKKVMPGILIPEYIPGGYELDSLDISKYINGTYIANYSFTDGNNHFTIYIYKANEERYEPGTTTIGVNGEMVELEDRILYIWHEEIEETYGVIILKDLLTIDIDGDISQNEMITIAESLN